MLKAELERRREYFGYTQQLQDLTMQEQSAAARLSYERLLADKRSVDNQLEETEASTRLNCYNRTFQLAFQAVT